MALANGPCPVKGTRRKGAGGHSRWPTAAGSQVDLFGRWDQIDWL
jgi:hypothetical protein